MKKRVLFFILSIMLTVCFVSIFVACDTNVVDQEGNTGEGGEIATENILYQLTEDGSGAVVVGIGGGFKNENIVIPDKVKIKEKEYSVVEIGEKALQNFDTVYSVTLPKSLKKIADSAFFDCDLLESITIPEGVTKIGKDAFMKCKSLKSISLPSSITGIEAKCFSDCISLEKISFPDRIKKIEEGMFNNCTSLVSCNLNKVEDIGKYAFSGCTSLADITFPESVTTVQEGAFAYCEKININITNTKVVFADNVFTEGIFLGLTLLDFMDIQGISRDMVKQITANYGNNVLTISEQESGLAIVKADCSEKFDFIINSPYFNGKRVIEICDNAFEYNDKLTDITIPDSVTKIGNYAFNECSAITSVIIPNSVKSMGDSAFGGCGALESITLPFIGATANANEASESILFGYIFGKQSYDGAIETAQNYSDEESVSYYIPQKLKTIVVTGGNLLYGAFSDCSFLESITITNSVTSIGDSAFGGCASLTSITIPDSVTKIGNYAYNECSAIRSIIIPDSVTSIGDSAFA